MAIGVEIQSVVKNIFGEVKGYGHTEQIQINCPRCQEDEGLLHPDGKFNLEINTRALVFRCWKCNNPYFSGSLGRLIRKYGSQSDYEEYKLYAGIFVDEPTSTYYEKVKLPEEFISFSELDIKNPDHMEAYNYLVLERKIPRDIIFKYKLGFCLGGRYAKKIIVPSYNINGEVDYFVGRSYDPKSKRPKYDSPKADKSNIIFNEGYIDWDSTIYLCEGAFEMLSFPVNTIPLLGKSILKRLFFKLKEKKPNVVVLLDPDAHKNTVDLYYMLYSIYTECEDRVKIVKLEGDYDLDEINRYIGREEIINNLYQARPLTVDDVFERKIYYERRQ